MLSANAPRIATSGLVQHRTSVIHGLFVILRILRVKSVKSDWLRIRNEFSAHAQKVGSGQRSRFLVLTKRSAASRNKNAYILAIHRFRVTRHNINRRLSRTCTPRKHNWQVGYYILHHEKVLHYYLITIP